MKLPNPFEFVIKSTDPIISTPYGFITKSIIDGAEKRIWPENVDFKVMRLPAELEDELKSYARQLLR